MTLAAYRLTLWLVPALMLATGPGLILVGLAMVIDSFRPER